MAKNRKRNSNSLDSALETMSDTQAINMLQAEGRKLEQIAIKIWRQYLDSYSPKKYVRTMDSLKAIKLKQMKRLEGDFIGIELTWENDLAYHDSVIKKGNHQQGHAVMLISNGWRVKSGKHKDVYRFGYYEGFDYIGKVQREYNAVKNPQVTLEVQWSGRTLR